MGSKQVRVDFYDDLKETSKISKIKMSALLTLAWEHYKKSDEYAKRILFNKQGEE